MKRSPRAFQRFQPQQLPHGHASVVARIPFYLDQLRLSATHVDGPHWHALHVVPNVTLFELEHGLEQLRFAHNHRGMLEAARNVFRWSRITVDSRICSFRSSLPRASTKCFSSARFAASRSRAARSTSVGGGSPETRDTSRIQNSPTTCRFRRNARFQRRNARRAEATPDVPREPDGRERRPLRARRRARRNRAEARRGDFRASHVGGRSHDGRSGHRSDLG